MTSRVELERTVEFVPDLSHPDADLLERFQTRYANTCSREYGFILRVLDVLVVRSRKISIYNGHVILSARIVAECFFPRPGVCAAGVVQQTFPQGAIVWVAGCMKTFVPTEPTTLVFALVGQTVEVELTQTRFQKGRYDSIGRYVHPNYTNP
jgi:DNA-directed RNA polymerase subunit E'/Rpb7